MLKVLSRIVKADYEYRNPGVSRKDHQRLMKEINKPSHSQKLDELNKEIESHRSSLNYYKERSASANTSDERKTYEKKAKFHKQQLEKKLKERDALKVTSKLVRLMAGDKKEELNKELGIDTFIKQADSIEKQSDFLTYHQIQRIGNPLSQKMKMEMQKLQKLGDKESVDYLKQLLNSFVQKKWINS